MIFGSLIVTYADSAVQTDWSGGPGVLGPVTDWNDQFYLDIYIEWNGSAGSITLQTPVEHTVDGDFNNAYSVYSEDIDGDGDMDILGAASLDNDIMWWENIDGSGTSWTEHTVDNNFNGARCVYSADINGDGDMDIIGAASDADDITWWENVNGLGTSWNKYTIFGEFDGAWSVYSRDIDGDNDMDIIGAARMDNDITWWENIDGLGTSWDEHSVDKDFWGTYSVYLEDIDGDLDMDVLGAALGACDITWWENTNGLGTSWTEHIVDDYFLGAISVYSEDIDGDGDKDILGAAYVADEITWWENVNGLGTSWAENTIAVQFDGANFVYSDDMDGDGDMDVLGAAFNGNDITWWENVDGLGTSWTEHIVDGDYLSAASVYSEDINGDGDMDVLGAATEDDDITWWNLTEYSNCGELVSSILYLGNDPGWGTIDWSVSTPSGTSVSFIVRASDDCGDMGVWSDTLTAPCSLAGILNDYDSYFQYKVILETANPETATPSLHDITLSWDPLEIEESTVPEISLSGPVRNPSSGPVTMEFTLSESSFIELHIFDASGRLVEELVTSFPPGENEVVFSDLHPGVYLIRMQVRDFSASRRFVVVE